MGFTSASAILGLIVLASCATQQRDAPVEPSSGNGSAAPKPQSLANGLTPPSGEPSRAASVHIENVAPGRFLINAAAEVEIATAATLERRSPDDRWTSEPFALREGCAPPTSEVPTCRALKPGEPFNPLSWNGTSCGPCCAEQQPTPIERGTYRLTLRACDDSSVRWQGPSFDMPGATDALERSRAIVSPQKASLFQLSNARRKEEDGSDDRHIIGYPIVAGSEVALSTSLVAALSDWLTDAGGFSDAVMRRCISGKRFGFRLDRDVPRLGTERSEVSVELNCRLIVVANQEGSLRPRSYSYFDNSQQALLAILREAMPGAIVGSRQR